MKHGMQDIFSVCRFHLPVRVNTQAMSLQCLFNPKLKKKKKRFQLGISAYFQPITSKIVLYFTFTHKVMQILKM